MNHAQLNTVLALAQELAGKLFLPDLIEFVGSELAQNMLGAEGMCVLRQGTDSEEWKPLEEQDLSLSAVLHVWGSPHFEAQFAAQSPICHKDTPLCLLPIDALEERFLVFFSFAAVKCDEDLTLLHHLFPHIVTAFRNATQFQQLQGHVEEYFENAAKLQEEIGLVHQSVQVLGRMGQEISTKHTLKDIVSSVYENVNTLMDASLFSIGLYNAQSNTIDMPATIEKDVMLDFHAYSMEEESRLAVHCFKNEQEIIINNIEKEYALYIPGVELPPIKAGEMPASIIYLPVYIGSGPIGVITVQSFSQNAYSEHHIDILKNLAVYVAIALENAEFYKRIEQTTEELAEQKDIIEEKNDELAYQKNKIEEAYKNVKMLGEIGKNIISSLSVEKITERTYENVNELMDAAVFWVGVHDVNENAIVFKGAKEKGETLDPFQIDLSEDGRIGVRSFKNQEEIVINDFQNEYSRYIDTINKPIVGEEPESIIYIPIQTRDKAIGVLTVQSFAKHAYTNYHLNILRNLAVYIGIALENAVLYENLEDKVRERTAEVVAQKEEIEQQRDQVQRAYQNIELLSEIGQKITQVLSVDRIIELVYKNVNALMDASAFGLGILRPEQGQIEFRGAMEEGQKLPIFYHDMDDDKRYSVWCILHNREVIINDHAKEYQRYIPELKPPEVGNEPESLLYLPIIVKGGVIGVITVQSFQQNAYAEYHINLLRNLAVYIGIAIENAEAYQQIESQKEEIQKTSQKITSSINYGKRIQDAILPSKKAMQAAFDELFVLYRPRDIVSGDFYWFTEVENKIVIAAVDCTGHGVPGAFMSMIGNDLLNEIVILLGHTEPGEILNELHRSIRDELRQTETGNRDGMDMALCVIDKEEKVLRFAGAKNPLIYIQGDKLRKISGDKLPVGGVQKAAERRFTTHEVAINQPTTFYIFSDGYQDQFGGEDGRKFMVRRFRDLLYQSRNLPLHLQAELLEEALNSWQGARKQTDDVLVMGFRIG